MKGFNGFGQFFAYCRMGSRHFCSLAVRSLAVALGVVLVSVAHAQDSSVGLRMVPELTLMAPAGTSNILQVSSSLGGTWSNLANLYFASTNPVTVVDQRPGPASQQFYRLFRITADPTNQPPFAAPTSNLVWIVPGTFLMGSPVQDSDRNSIEEPPTLVTLTKGWFMGQFEVTQGEYVSVVGSNPSEFAGDPKRPVETVSWQQATNYCRLLNIREAAGGRLPGGWAYRLPTEAEWEFAARSGGTNRFSYGYDTNYVSLGQYAWGAGNSSAATQPVGGKQPNAWGLYDMSGNVSEWCMNWFEIYPGGSVTDPAGPATGATKVARGGSYDDAPADLRLAARREFDYATAYKLFGLRVVLARIP